MRQLVALFLISFFALTSVVFAQQAKQEQFSQPSTTNPASTIITDPYERKKELVEQLAAHARWYHSSSLFYRNIFVSLSLAVSIGSVVTAMLVAIDFASRGGKAKAFVVGLPLLTGLFTSILSQFHVQDLWKLREIGRIDAMMLREQVRALPTAVNDVEMRTVLLPYEREKYELERRQATAFFDYLAPKEDAAKKWWRGGRE